MRVVNKMEMISVSHTFEKPIQAKKLFSQHDKEIVQIKLKAGEVIKEHRSPKHVFIFVAQGEVEFTVNGEEVEVNQERILYMEPDELHALKAITDVSLYVVKC